MRAEKRRAFTHTIHYTRCTHERQEMRLHTFVLLHAVVRVINKSEKGLVFCFRHRTPRSIYIIIRPRPSVYYIIVIHNIYSLYITFISQMDE